MQHLYGKIEQRIEQPQAFIAQETLDFSRHLVFDELEGKLHERYVDLRVFAVQNGNGEVTRVSRRPHEGLPGFQPGRKQRIGGSCKPSWVVR